MRFKQRTLTQIADMICGNFPPEETVFKYRSSSFLTEFFQDCDTDYEHDGSTRKNWVVGVLAQILDEPQPAAHVPPETFCRVVRILMDQGDAVNEGPDRPGALSLLNGALAREGFEAFFAADKQCYVRHLASDTVASAMANPHRPFSQAEVRQRERLQSFLATASEDSLIEESCFRFSGNSDFSV